MKESTEELKAIANNKPDEATHIDDDLIYIKDGDHSCDYFDNECNAWCQSLQTPLTRSLSDMEEIIKLREFKERVRSLIEWSKEQPKETCCNVDVNQLREFIAGLQLSASDQVKANELLGVDDGY